MTLPQKVRIKDRKDLQVLFRSGKPSSTEHLHAKVIVTGSKRQVAVLVPLKTAAKASARNRMRRQVSESLRTLLPKTVPGYHLVITVRKSPLPLPPALKDELVSLLDKSGILNR
jgi:ribonuclease P protein component